MKLYNTASVLGLRGRQEETRQVEKLVKQVMEQYGQIDVWFNNAGLLVLGQTLAQTDPEQWDPVGRPDFGFADLIIVVPPIIQRCL